LQGKEFSKIRRKHAKDLNVQKRKIGVLLLLGLLIVGGIMPVFNEIASSFVTLLDSFQDEISTINGGEGGGGGWPHGSGP
jgi:hypothetical protein